MQTTLIIYPSFKLLFFAPFLILAAKELEFTKLFFPAFITGLTLDLYANGMPFGFYTLLSVIIMLISPLWIRSYFKNEGIVYVSSALLFVGVWTILEALLSVIFKLPAKFSTEGLINNFLISLCLNITYFFLAILLPFKLILKQSEEN